MTHGTVILCTKCDVGKRRPHFYCDNTSAGEKGASVNSHQNSHDARTEMPNDLLLLCFSYGTVDNRCVGHFRLHVKIQQFVVLRRLFDRFVDPQQNSHMSFLVVVLMKTLDFGPTSQTPQLRMTLFSHDPPKNSLYLFQCQHISIISLKTHFLFTL